MKFEGSGRLALGIGVEAVAGGARAVTGEGTLVRLGVEPLE